MLQRNTNVVTHLFQKYVQYLNRLYDKNWFGAAYAY